MIETTTHTTDIGEATLEERHTMIALALGPAGLAWSYRRPTAVTHRGVRRPIPDITLNVKLAALALMLLATIIRRART